MMRSINLANLTPLGRPFTGMPCISRAIKYSPNTPLPEICLVLVAMGSLPVLAFLDNLA